VPADAARLRPLGTKDRVQQLVERIPDALDFPVRIVVHPFDAGDRERVEKAEGVKLTVARVRLGRQEDLDQAHEVVADERIVPQAVVLEIPAQVVEEPDFAGRWQFGAEDGEEVLLVPHPLDTVLLDVFRLAVQRTRLEVPALTDVPFPRRQVVLDEQVADAGAEQDRDERGTEVRLPPRRLWRRRNDRDGDRR